MTSTDISYQDRGTYCVPIYTSTSNQVSNLLNQLPLTSNRKDYNHSRYNALSSILRAIQLDADNIIYCPLNKSAYTVWGWPISYKPMIDVLDMLCHAEWLIRKKPRYDMENKGTVYEPQQSDRFIVPDGSPLLLNKVIEFTEMEWSPPVVQVRRPDTRVLDVAFMSKPLNRSFLKKYVTPRMEKLNAYVAEHEYEMWNHGFEGWVQYYQGGLTGCGGRLWANYMLDSEADRLQDYKIDGEPVVEIDIHASGATIIAARENLPIPDVDDIYSSLKVHGLERDLAKAVINHSISVGGLNKKDFPNRIRKDPRLGPMARKVTWSSLRDQLKEEMPWLTRLDPKSNEALYVQWKDSEIIIATMTKVFEAGVGCLSVHESLIVPQSQLELGKAALIEAFEKHTGVVPKLNIRYPS